MPMIACRQAPQQTDFSSAAVAGSFPMRVPFKLRGGGSGGRRDKVVVVMGATGTGKSRLAIDLATRFAAEVVNSDKMQVYDGLDVVTNKVTEEEQAGIPHHLLGGVPPDADFTARDFCYQASLSVESILSRGRVPIIAGGSNTYIEELMEKEHFRYRYDCCFLWVDVEVPVLHAFIGERVDRMVERGLVEEVRGVFDPGAGAPLDYSRGIRRAIGVPEMDRYFRAEAAGAEGAVLEAALAAAVEEIKGNTCKLAVCQLQKIHRLRGRWGAHRVDATKVFRRRGKEVDEAWEEVVAEPSIETVRRFLFEDGGVESGGGSGEEVVIMAAGKRAAAAKLLSAVEAVGATV